MPHNTDTVIHKEARDEIRLLAEAVEGNQRRVRRTNSLKSDQAIWKAIAKYQIITPEILSEITHRQLKTIQRRLRTLYEAHDLNRQRSYFPHHPFAYFFAEKGAQEVVRLGYFPEVRFVKGTSWLVINHDLELTLLHRALEKSFGQVDWKQWRGDLKYEIDGAALIPDAKFKLHDKVFFLEVVKSYESEYQDGELNIMHKAGLYMGFKPHSYFRVLWVLPTKARVFRVLSKLEQKYPSRRFYVTDEKSCKTNIKGKIFWTPKDFRDRTYSIES